MRERLVEQALAKGPGLICDIVMRVVVVKGS